MNDSSTLSQLAELALVAIVGLVLFTALGIFAAHRTYTYPRRRSRYRHPPLYFAGHGTGNVEAESLIESTYRIDYQFSGDGLVKIELIETASGNSDTILLKSGSGTAGFRVQHAGHHRLHIAPLQEDTSWELSIQPVGQASVRS